MTVPRLGSDRVERPERDQTKARERGRARRWESRIGSAVAYAPHWAGTIGGLAGILLAPNKIVGVSVLLAGQLVDAVKTYWDRRIERKKESDADR
jgi:hypothetical protein